VLGEVIRQIAGVLAELSTLSEPKAVATVIPSSESPFLLASRQRYTWSLASAVSDSPQKQRVAPWMLRATQMQQIQVE
jgi:hypothetical protein